MSLNPAGFIDGACLSGETLRRALYASTGGSTGTTRPPDLAVYAQTIPAASVVIAPGGGVIATRYTDADPGQSYSVSNPEPYTLAVPANGTTSVKRWEVIIRVSDPQYAGEPIPADPENDPYSVVELVSTFPVNKPYLHLATIEVPASTGVVQQSYIIDRRELAQPRSSRVLKAIAIPAQDPLDWDQYEQWPDAGLWPIYVPEWATEARVVCTWQNIASMPGTNISELTVALGWNRPDMVRINSTHMVLGYSTSQGSNEQRRQTIGVADTVKVPASWRGQTLTVMSNGRKKEGTVNLIADSWASVTLDIQFVEAPSQEGAWSRG